MATELLRGLIPFEANDTTIEDSSVGLLQKREDSTPLTKPSNDEMEVEQETASAEDADGTSEVREPASNSLFCC